MAHIDGDTDTPIRVYEGHLTKKRVTELTKEPDYEAQAVCKTEEGYYVTFTSCEDYKPEMTPDGPVYYDGKGDLSYDVILTETERDQ